MVSFCCGEIYSAVCLSLDSILDQILCDFFFRGLKGATVLEVLGALSTGMAYRSFYMREVYNRGPVNAVQPRTGLIPYRLYPTCGECHVLLIGTSLPTGLLGINWNAVVAGTELAGNVLKKNGGYDSPLSPTCKRLCVRWELNKLQLPASAPGYAWNHVVVVDYCNLMIPLSFCPDACFFSSFDCVERPWLSTLWARGRRSGRSLFTSRTIESFPVSFIIYQAGR